MAKMSALRLGSVPYALALPVQPLEAQFSAATMNLQIKVSADGEYISIPRMNRTINPDNTKETIDAIKACPDVMTYSGSKSIYKALVVDKDPDHPTGRGTIRAGVGGPVLVRFYYDADVELVSLDEMPAGLQSAADADNDDPGPDDDMPDEPLN